MNTRVLVPVAGLVIVGAVAAGCSSDRASDGRVITMTATDTLRFEPATVNARAGERVTFRITNDGNVAHEFVIGDRAFHDMHASGMSGGGHGNHATTGNGDMVVLPPGKTANLRYTMPAQPPTFACHVDKHDAAGMTGTITY